MSAFRLSSPAFSAGGPIPRAHTCDGADQSPPLVWADAPAETQEFALLMDDPDAPGPTFTHWVLYAIPGNAKGLPTGLPKEAELRAPITARQGLNDFRRAGYGGPCPPKGAPHHYQFALYALSAPCDLPPGAARPVAWRALEKLVLAEARLTGTYGRP